MEQIVDVTDAGSPQMSSQSENQRGIDHFKSKVKFIWVVATDEHKKKLVKRSRRALSIEDFLQLC